MGAQRSRPQTAVRSANHPARSSAVAVREPGLVDGITRLQQTAGNRATAARLVAIQRDAAKQPGPVSSVNPDYDQVYKGYWSLDAGPHAPEREGRVPDPDGLDGRTGPRAHRARRPRDRQARHDHRAPAAAHGHPGEHRGGGRGGEGRVEVAVGGVQAGAGRAGRRLGDRPGGPTPARPARQGRPGKGLHGVPVPHLRRHRRAADDAGEQDPRPVGHPPGRGRVPAAQEGRDGQAAALQQLPDPHPRRRCGERRAGRGRGHHGRAGRGGWPDRHAHVRGRGARPRFRGRRTGAAVVDGLHHAGAHAVGVLRLPGARDQRRRARHLRRHVLVGHLLPGGAEDGEDRQLRARVGVRRGLSTIAGIWKLRSIG